MVYSSKNPNKSSELVFRFGTLTMEILEKAKLHPWKFCNIVLHTLEIPRPKTKTYGNLT